jgi:2-hydroxy-6-oxonona-2,4-dienedioate hydrolase
MWHELRCCAVSDDGNPARLFKSPAAKTTIAAAYARCRAALPPHNVHRLATNAGMTQVLSAGPAGGRAIVVLHGTMGSAAHVLHEVLPLLDNYHVHAIDVIGQSVGSEDRTMSVHDGSYSVWLDQVVGGLGLDRPHLIGISLGGHIAREFATAHPQKLQSLSLLVPAGIVSGPKLPLLRQLAIPLCGWLLFKREASLQTLANALFTRPTADAVRYVGEVFAGYNLRSLQEPKLASDNTLRALAVPLQVIGAELDHAFPGAEMLTRVCKLLPNADLHLLSDSKHAPPQDSVSREQLCILFSKFIETHALL